MGLGYGFGQFIMIMRDQFISLIIRFLSQGNYSAVFFLLLIAIHL